jgi:hypothetical protein
MLHCVLPAWFSAPKPSTDSRVRQPKPRPANKLGLDLNKVDDYILEENMETIDVEEPNGMEENKVNEGQGLKVSHVLSLA